MSISPLPPDTETVVIFQPNSSGALLSMNCQNVIHIGHKLATLFWILLIPDCCIRHKQMEPLPCQIYWNDCMFAVFGGRGRIHLGSRGIISVQNAQRKILIRVNTCSLPVCDVIL